MNSVTNNLAYENAKGLIFDTSYNQTFCYATSKSLKFILSTLHHNMYSRRQKLTFLLFCVKKRNPGKTAIFNSEEYFTKINLFKINSI